MIDFPIQEKIVLDVIDTLKGISTEAGYYNTITSVARPNPALGSIDQDRSLLVVQGQPTRIDDAAQMHSEWDLPISIVCSVIESEHSTTPIDQRLNTLRADVEKALAGTRVATSRNGLASDTIVNDPDYSQPSLVAHEGEVTVNVTVKFRTLANDPYTLG
jgi:hypothetical protein